MSRCLSWACAGALLLAAAGCSLDSFVVGQVVTYGPKLTVPGTVSQVSNRLREGLSEAGIAVNVNRIGSDFRIAGLSKTRAFCLHLYARRENGEDRTLVRVQWDRGGDDELWGLIQKILQTPDAKPDEADARPQR